MAAQMWRQMLTNLTTGVKLGLNLRQILCKTKSILLVDVGADAGANAIAKNLLGLDTEGKCYNKQVLNVSNLFAIPKNPYGLDMKVNVIPNKFRMFLISLLYIGIHMTWV